MENVMAKELGYGNTEWGMNPRQVVESEKGKAIPIQSIKYAIGLGKVQIKNIEIESALYTITFIFNELDQLIQTNLVGNERKNVGIVLMQFKSLNQLLTQKYGNPIFRDDDTVIWQTETTTIELRTMIIPLVDFAQVIVRYVPNETTNRSISNL